MHRTSAPFALALLGGCKLVDPTDGDLPCAALEDCLEGYTCVTGYCRPDACTGEYCGPEVSLDFRCSDANPCNEGSCEVDTDGVARCRRSCTVDDDCGSGHARCIFGACQRLCASDLDCRGGLVCDVDTGSCRTSLPPPAAFGARCEVHHQCWSGHCSPRFNGGVCTSACTHDDDCGPGTACETIDGEQICLLTCGSSADCGRDDVTCTPLVVGRHPVCVDPAVLPPRAGDACTNDCGATTLACFVGEPGGYCSATCQADSECGIGGHCLAGAKYIQQRCMRSCFDVEPCSREGYVCSDVDLDGRGECVPAGVGPKGLGDECNSGADCGFGDRAVCALGVARPFCSATCTPGGVECGTNARCVQLTPGRSWCFPTCDPFAAPCQRDDFKCVSTNDGPACLPG